MDVAVAVIFNESNQILITRRACNAPHGGKWEFPGGKLEAGETAEQALHREIKEEVGLDILDSAFLGKIGHDYGNRLVNLFVYIVPNFIGTASCKESQMDLAWVDFADLESGCFDFPEANSQIISMLAELTEV